MLPGGEQAAMRYLICGSRTFSDPYPISVVVSRLRESPGNSCVIHGGAKGADTLAGRSAERMGIPVECYPADWSGQGRGAGHIRNQKMLTEGDPSIVWAFVDKPLAESRGTADMVRRARKAGIATYVIEIPAPPPETEG